MEWLVISSLTLFIGVMVWGAFYMSRDLGLESKDNDRSGKTPLR